MPKETVHEIHVPASLGLSQAIAFQQRLLALPPADEYVINFSRMGWLPPFAMLIISDTIRRCRYERSSATFKAVGFDKHTYPAHMGFFQAFGLDRGNMPGGAAGSLRYLPITRLDFSDLYGSSAWSSSNPQERLDAKCKQMARVLTRADDGDLCDTLGYALREIVRNALEHSQAGAASYCAQYWPTKGQVELAILDTGIGLRASLAENPHLEVPDDASALGLAIAPGVSGKFFEGVAEDTDDPWQNSGFGLYMVKRLCARGGSFFLASGSSGLFIRERDRREMPTEHKGVAMRLLLDTNKMEPIQSALGRYKAEAHAIAGQCRDSDRLSASLVARIFSREQGSAVQ